MSPYIKPVNAAFPLIGTAFTIQASSDVFAMVNALQEANKGDVLVVDSEGSQYAVVGEIIASEALRIGVRGIIVDGTCRDIEVLKDFPFPVFTRHVTPAVGSAQKIGKHQIPLQCGGVTVHPGDIVFGDANGVIFMSVEEMERSLPSARATQQKDTFICESLKKGTALKDLCNFDEHKKALLEGSASKFRFKAD